MTDRGASYAGEAGKIYLSNHQLQLRQRLELRKRRHPHAPVERTAAAPAPPPWKPTSAFITLTLAMLTRSRFQRTLLSDFPRRWQRPRGHPRPRRQRRPLARQQHRCQLQSRHPSRRRRQLQGRLRHHRLQRPVEKRHDRRLRRRCRDRRPARSDRRRSLQLFFLVGAHRRRPHHSPTSLQTATRFIPPSAPATPHTPTTAAPAWPHPTPSVPHPCSSSNMETLFPGQYMRASTLKGLLIHTATDCGNPGPDYKYGWGLVNVQAAADLIRDHHAFPRQTRITESQLTTTTITRTLSFVSGMESPPITATLSLDGSSGHRSHLVRLAQHPTGQQPGFKNHRSRKHHLSAICHALRRHVDAGFDGCPRHHRCK